ncbi:MAG: MBL fold metallo-hydrolase [Candidatus Hodarchaeales archaeon]
MPKFSLERGFFNGRRRVIEFYPQHWLIKHPILAHTFFWENTDGSISLYDSGTSKTDAHHALSAIKKLGYNFNDIRDIIISHCHFDHIGGLHTIKRGNRNVQIIAHKVETHFLKNPLRLDNRHLRSIARWVYAPFFRYYDTRPIQVDEVVTSKTKNPFYNFIHLPGHTLGSMGIQLKDSGIIFTGDAFFTGKNGHIDYSPPIFSLDPTLERKSIPKLMDYEFEILVSSHGLPIKEAKIRLDKFLQLKERDDSSWRK